MAMESPEHAIATALMCRGCREVDIGGRTSSRCYDAGVAAGVASLASSITDIDPMATTGTAARGSLNNVGDELIVLLESGWRG
mgnify:CR=1 FL=1